MEEKKNAAQKHRVVGMTERKSAKPAGRVDDEVLERLPSSFKVIVEFVREQQKQKICNSGDKVGSNYTGGEKQ